MGAPTKSLVAELKKKAARAKSLLAFYNPDKFPASVLYYRKDDWPLKVETAQIDLMEALFYLTESMDGADNQEDLVECEEIVKNITEEAVKFTIQFNIKLISHSTESGLQDSGATIVSEDQDKLDIDVMDLMGDTKVGKIVITTDPEVAVSSIPEGNHKIGCEVKDSRKAFTVRHRLGDQAFVTFNGMFGLSSEHELFADSKFGHCGVSMLCDTTSCSTGPDFAIMDIVKAFTFITRSKSVAIVSAAATHGDHTDRTGIGGECRYEEKLDCVHGIAFTADLACLDNYCARIVSSSKNVYVYSYTHLQVS